MLLLAAIVAALAVPVGFAWSLDSAPMQAVHVSHLPTTAVASTAAAAVTSSVVITAPAADRATRGAVNMPAVPDAAKLLLVGTILFGLAAFVRKAI
ncbi:MAG: hypothetical protein AUH43_07125 [Acidobacteria bacterium 13_1_40CM_65_14]|nr:MAG: hypothetical protein AUH43_07125 [Acidobacteria bacterium 13_1_40CM_65_14]OLC80115.1 MAG: hypothetical protein AUH72_12565 [Acidobacteria bacterium 13_1_40CM_4_65_8]OLE78694.1 MAG: hypothetical protein AUF76_18655 [Acidobacteria bacterium 13_1_20CM_2_65_9]